MTRRSCPVCGSPINTAGETACWRHRRAGTRRSRAPHRDPVTPAVYAAVRARDGGCLGPEAGLPGDCAGMLEVDHVYGEGLGRRGPSVEGNLATLCRAHHRYKTEHARVSRPKITAVIRARSDRGQTVDNSAPGGA